MQQLPEAGSFHLKWVADIFKVALKLDSPVKGRAVFRTNIGKAHLKREEIIAGKESGDPILARDWHDVPMVEKKPGVFSLSIPLLEVGIFSGKACFFAENSDVPQWSDGDNMVIKVEPAHTACANTIYSAFVRQFGEALYNNPANNELSGCISTLDQRGYTVIPPSGTFRDLMRRLDTIMGVEHFRILQLLPVHPIPTTYARMGRYGSAFAALDFFSVDPSLAEFDKSATPPDQFRELINAVHSRGGYLYMDLPLIIPAGLPQCRLTTLSGTNASKRPVNSLHLEPGALSGLIWWSWTIKILNSAPTWLMSFFSGAGRE
jgi:hypothetical protein